MSGRRRAYPTPQYATGQAQPQDDPAARMANLNLGQAQPIQPGQPQFGVSPQVAPAQPYQAQAAPFAAQPAANGQFGGQQAPYVAPNSPYGAQATPYGGQSTPYGGQSTPYGTQSTPYGAQPQLGGQNQFGASPYGQINQTPGQSYGAIPFNNLYHTDLSKELPPPITDLSLPPPPIVLPPNLTVVPRAEQPNISPEYLRSTLNVVPTSSAVLKKSKLPFALVVNPYTTLRTDDENVPTCIDTLVSRCRRCRSYINPYVILAEQGRRWRCNFCQLANDFPAGFDGPGVDKFDRPELNSPIVEFLAPPEYMSRAPQPLVYTFIIDVSVQAVKSGLTGTIARTILESLDRIPNASQTTKVAFIGVDSNLHYFKFHENSDEFEVLVVSDIDEPFLPSPDGLLVNMHVHRAAIEKFLLDFATYFEDTTNGLFALGPALKSGHKLVSGIGGKLVAFAATLPNLGEGKLQLRESQDSKGKDSRTLLNAADGFYKSFAVTCNASQVSIDLFLTCATYQDVATLANLPRYTAGQTHFYAAWTSATDEDVQKLSKEVSDHLSQDIAVEAVLRFRGSSGLRMLSFYGNFFNRSSDLCAFPAFPRDQSYVIEVSIEENITKPVVFLQGAVLHTTSRGERRIRVINLALPTSSNFQDVYALADQLAITNFYTHKAIEKALGSSLGDARDYLTARMVDILNVYKKELFAGNVSGALPLQLSTNLRMLPLLLFSLSKNLAFRDDRVSSDHRAAALNILATAPIPQLIKHIYPLVYLLHNMDDACGLAGENGEIVLPEPVNDSSALWENYGLFLIDNGSELFLWVSGNVVPELVRDVFGTDDLYSIRTGKSELPELEDSEFNLRVRQIVAKLRQLNDQVTWKNLYVVLGGSLNEPMEISQQRELMALRMWALSNLVEDKTGGSGSYREYLTALRGKMTN